MATQSRLPAFLLTRPTPQSKRFAKMLRDEFGAEIEAVISPLLAPAFIDEPLPAESFRGLIFTSETGVAAFARQSAPKIPNIAWCVGDRTAQAAAQAGLEPTSAQGDVEALFALLVDQAKAPLLYIHGAETRGNLAERLNNVGLKTVSFIGYEQRSQPLSAQAETMLGEKRPLIVPLFSPRSAALFVDQLSKTSVTAPILYVAISPSVAEVLANAGMTGIKIATNPSAQAMILAVAGVIAAQSGS